MTMRPLAGMTIIEAGGIGPAPFATMMLADMGADVLRIVRPGDPGGEIDLFGRGKRTLSLDLRSDDGKAALMDQVAAADALVEGFRPGVMEKLGLGPDRLLSFNPRLVYGRMTGWGQDGPEARKPGHDINYLALSGVLHMIGPRDRPAVPPLNLVGDFGGGGLLMACGLLAAIHGTRTTGKGCVVDAAMIDGILLQATMIHALYSLGHWIDRRESNLLDGGAYFYGVYATADGGEMAVGAVEPQFHKRFIEGLGLPIEQFSDQMDHGKWAERRALIAALFRKRSRAEWTDIFTDGEACVTPVLNLAEARAHPHLQARASWMETGLGVVPAPAPRFVGAG
jgi:alpha-methylacyl-CoA racemase